MHTLVDDFIKDCKLRGRTDRTLENYRCTVREFLTYFPNPKHVDNEELRVFLGILQRRDLKTSTLKGHFSALSSFFDYLEFEKIVIKNPVISFRKRYLDKPVKNDRRQLLSVNQMRELIDSIPTNDILALAIMLFLAKTGARRNEFINMLVADIDIERKIIKLPQAEKRYNRFIPMDDELLTIMELYLKWRKKNARPDNIYLWLSPRGCHMKEERPNEIIARYAEPLGLHEPNGALEKRLTCYCFRKFFTHHLTKNGMPELYLQVLRGDSLKDAAWKNNYVEPEDLINEEIRDAFMVKVPQLICY